MVWEIDPVHSSIGFGVTHMMVSTVRGRFGGVRGTITFDPATPERAAAEVVIDATTVDTGMPQRDAHLKSPHFFDAQNHPLITFTSTRVERLWGGRYRIAGELTIRGVTKPVVLDAELLGIYDAGKMGTRAGISARGTLDRKDFGLEWNAALEAGGVLVGDRVRLELEIEAVQQAEALAA